MMKDEALLLGSGSNIGRADLSEDLLIILAKFVKDLNDPNKAVGEFSFTITLPYTQANKALMKNVQHKGVVGKFKASYEATYVVNSNIVLRGFFNHTKNTPKGFEGFLTGLKGANISTIIGEDTLRDIQSFPTINFNGDLTIEEYLSKDLYWKPSYDADPNKSEVCFPLVPNSFWKLNNPAYYNQDVANDSVSDVYDWAYYNLISPLPEGMRISAGYEDFPPSFFIGAILENIFRDAGYRIEGNILSDELFKKAILLYSNEKGEDLKYNYGHLNPMWTRTLPGTVVNGKLLNGTAKQITTIEAVTDIPHTTYEVVSTPNSSGGVNTYTIERKVMCLMPNYRVTSGDLSFSFHNHSVQEGKGHNLYVPKYSGNYHIKISTVVRFWEMYRPKEDRLMSPVSWTDINSTQQSPMFACFREVSGAQYLEEQDWDARIVNKDFFKPDSSTLLSQYVLSDPKDPGTRYISMEGTCYLEQGKTYQLQIYAQGSDTDLYEYYFERVFSDGYFAIVSCDGPQQIRLADFLPEMSKQDFVSGVFKLFNLYYNIDPTAKKIKLYTRDEFFSQDNPIVDLTGRCNLDEWEESPPTKAELAAVRFKYNNDSKDYALEKAAQNTTTTYLALANGQMGNDAKELPFAPLTMWKKPFYWWELRTGFWPFIMTTSNATPDKLLKKEYTNQFQYAPRIALYEGKAFGDNFNFQMRFVRSETFSSGNFQTRAISMPFARMFPVSKHPYLEFSLRTGLVLNVEGEGSVLRNYNPGFPGGQNTIFYRSQAHYDSANGTGIQLQISDNSVVRRLYRNTYLVNNLSHYLEGPIRMDEVLYRKLDGKQILKVEDDLYLLESIQNFDVNSITATLRMIKLLSL